MKLSEIMYHFTFDPPSPQPHISNYFWDNLPDQIEGLDQEFGEHGAASFCAGMGIMLECIRRYGIPDDMDEIYKEEQCHNDKSN